MISRRAEDAVHELLDIFQRSYVAVRYHSTPKDPSIVPPDETPEQKAKREKLLHREHEFEEEAKELVIYFNNKFVDSLLTCIRNSLDAIKRRVFPAYVATLLYKTLSIELDLFVSFRWLVISICIKFLTPTSIMQKSFTFLPVLHLPSDCLVKRFE